MPGVKHVILDVGPPCLHLSVCSRHGSNNFHFLKNDSYMQTDSHFYRKKLDAFETRYWWKVLQKPWPAQKPNQWVLDQIMPELSLETKTID